MQAKTPDGPPDGPPDDSVDARVRRRLRELRSEQGLTLQQVSERAHIDVSMLSRLESGKRRLALDHIAGLAQALGVTSDDLLGSAPPADPRVRSEPVKRDGMTMWPLTNRGPAGGLHAFKIRIGSRRRTPPATLRVHAGHDWMYVLEGRMRLVLGEQDLVIEPGEAVEFSTFTPHWFGAFAGPVEVIAVFGHAGEHTHLHE
ncbi:MAG: XRE family transcriptional regulator [Actinomycetota bacterium]|nr:XRE family transcriptional regulator [Actinomycetota bacterium]